MTQKSKGNSFYRFFKDGFLLPFLVLIGLWYLIYETFIIPSHFYNQVVIEKIALSAFYVLDFLGYDSFVNRFFNTSYVDHVGILESDGVVIGTGCDGLIILALFFFFVLCFKGRWKNKVWYIPSGLILLYVLNVFRIVGLAICMKINPDWLAFNHDYTFTVLMYAVVMLLWYVWVNRFSQT